MKKKRLIKTIVTILMMTITLSFASGCSKKAENPTATIKFSTGDEITIRLYYDKAPNTVLNFISLANSDFYNDLTIHRVIKYKLMQMGDPNANGTGDAGYYIKGEFGENNYKKNDLTHTPGRVAMARPGSLINDEEYYDMASCQFYILTGDMPELDDKYAVFGEVIRGFEKFAQLDKVDVDSSDKPLKDITITSIKIETFGEKYGEPKTISKDENQGDNKWLY